ncbi:hypothetical protein PIB30_014139 [Stylosanthes scabra]|uniref:CCHC-type domain-containing protein n=1 Tax=Stylosanthes scabra TaxID=79078 RepID=A0ABU6T6C0_9FABA|nr:hypothetical protein [Stylosanthes scabra]
MSMHAAMLDDCRELVRLCCHSFQDYFEVKRKIAKEREALLAKQKERIESNAVGDDGPVRDPAGARHKGCSRRVQTAAGRFRRVQRCRKCGKAGHNARRCDAGRDHDTGLDMFDDEEEGASAAMDLSM